MNLASIIALLTPFEPLIKQGLVSLDAAASAELSSVINNISSPDLKALLQALESGLNSFAQLEISKLP
jgi:hypothetical protein